MPFSCHQILSRCLLVRHSRRRIRHKILRKLVGWLVWGKTKKKRKVWYLTICAIKKSEKQTIPPAYARIILISLLKESITISSRPQQQHQPSEAMPLLYDHQHLMLSQGNSLWFSLSLSLFTSSSPSPLISPFKIKPIFTTWTHLLLSIVSLFSPFPTQSVQFCSSSFSR